MKIPTLLIATQLFLAACEAATGKGQNIPRGWRVIEKAPPDNLATFTLALEMEHIDSLESELSKVSDPKSPKYGLHWDKAEVHQNFAPSLETTSATLDWLAESGVYNYSLDWIFIDFSTDVATADRLLNASFHYYTNGVTTQLRTESYSVPDKLQQIVQLISPGVYLGLPNVLQPSIQRSVMSRTENPCLQAISPLCLKQMYNMTDYKPSTTSGSTIGFSSFLNQSALYQDLFEFESHFDIPPQNISIELVAGGKDNQNKSTAQFTEADLDAQTIVGIAYPLPVKQFIVGGKP